MQHRRLSWVLGGSTVLVAGVLVVSGWMARGREGGRGPAGGSSPASSVILSDTHSGAGGPLQQTGRSATFGEWFASGSGCYARDTQPGDVTREVVSESESGARVRFHLDEYRLSSEGRPFDSSRDLVSECSIRVAVAAPPGKRIAAAAAVTAIAVDKGAPTSVTLFNELKIGAASLGRFQEELRVGSALEGRVFDVHLAAGAGEATPIAPLPCGKRKILGFDYTWVAKPASAEDRVVVRLAGDRTVEIDVQFEPCPAGS